MGRFRLSGMIRPRSFSPSQAASRQGTSASAFCRSTIVLGAAVPHCNFGPSDQDRPDIGDRVVDLLAKGDAIELIEHRLVEPLDDAIIRYEIIGASLSGCSRKGTGDMVSPSETRGAGSTKVRAGRQYTVAREPELVTWPPPATFPDAPRPRISRCRVARQLPF
jgi:hypothetical protein